MFPIDRIALVCPFKQKGYANALEQARGLQNFARANSDRARHQHARHPTEEERRTAARVVPDLLSKLRAADDERRQAKRNSLVDKLTVEAKALADLKVEKAAVEGERRTVEADLGPVRYLSTLLGVNNETVLRWFILVVALLLDAAAVLLLFRNAPKL
jgi:hypothetical protein